MQLGHEVLLQPIYTPLRTDEVSVASETVRYGAVNLYLQQKSQLFGRLPRVVRNWLDSPGLLRRVTANPNATDARTLGELAVSMLRGESGRQVTELDALVQFLRDDYRPEVIQLTNSMLLGLAHRLRDEIPGVRIVTALQGEDLFLNELQPPYRARVEDELRRRALDSDLFVATSTFYADEMAEFLQVARERVLVTRLGISFDGYRPELAVANENTEATPLRIGYLARICPEKGLHQLVEAFALVAAKRPGEVRLGVAGYLGARDRAYFEKQQRFVADRGLNHVVDFVGEVDRQGKLAFLHGLDLLSVPTTYREAKGLPVLEAMAAGVPVLQPAHGAFPEILERTGGGWLHAPDDVGALANMIESILDDPRSRAEKARLAHAGVRREFGEDRMALETVAAYQQAVRLAPHSKASSRGTHE